MIVHIQKPDNVHLVPGESYQFLILTGKIEKSFLRISDRDITELITGHSAYESFISRAHVFTFNDFVGVIAWK